MEKRKKIAVIGAGLGGLSVAARCAAAGFDTTVYEQASGPGGKAGEINKEGFRFDTGPSLLTMPFVIEELFADLGEKPEDHLTFIKPEKLCEYFYTDGTRLSAWADIKKFAEEIDNKTADDKVTFLKYLDYSKRIYDLTADLFLNKSFTEKDTFVNLKALRTLLNIKNIDPFRSMHEANTSFFKDPKVIQLFDRYATYNGSDPYKAPATLNIIQHVEYNLGGYLPEGGIYTIALAIYNLARKKGARFRFGAPVREIVTVGNKITGVKMWDGTEEEHDIVISNADVNYTYKNLLRDSSSASAKKYASLEQSGSALVFYWGVKGNYPSLDLHNILFSANYKTEFRKLFTEKTLAGDPTVYVYISSKVNREDAPEGHENWFVMINAPANRGQDWDSEKEKMRGIILDKIKRLTGYDISDKIVLEETLTPLDLEVRTGSYRGSIYGISSNGRMAAFLRQQNRSKDYSGLYFCGGSAHPGGGIPLVILSARIAAELINKYEK